MRTDEIPTKHPSMWVPESDPLTLALIGKLGEEANELGARLFRAVIQGYQELDPDDGRSNADHIWDEIADVEAMITHIKNRRASAEAEHGIFLRRDRKFTFKLPWFDWLNAPPTPRTKTMIDKEAFCARFKARMMKALPISAGTAEELAEYADETAPTYFDEPWQREDGPEACAEADISYWEEG